MTWIENRWYVAAWDSEVDREPLARTIEILEAQQRSIEANPDLKLRACAIDAGGVRARRVIERVRAGALLPTAMPAFQHEDRLQ